MKKLVILSLVIASGFTACESNDEETTTETISTTKMVTPPPPPAPVTPAADTALARRANPNVTQIPVQQPVTQVPPPPINIASAPKLNPAHGQPGHRCDISVGAPLPTGGAPTAAAAQAATVPQPQPVQMTVPPPPPPVMRATPSTAGKMLNPAHGQPGHRCDIAVGAPLN